MTVALRLSLKGGERIYINGAVLRADRNVTLELLNDAKFLLQQHVMPVEETRTPLRQLYFMVQSLILEPATSPASLAPIAESLNMLAAAFDHPDIIMGLRNVAAEIDGKHYFAALRLLRALFSIEAEIIAARTVASEMPGDGNAPMHPTTVD